MVGKDLKIKVCGMNQDEVHNFLNLKVNYVGNIFLESSPRNQDKTLGFETIGKDTAKVGVFVFKGLGVDISETEIDEILVNKILPLKRKHQFDVIQFHGGEPDKLIKAAKSQLGLKEVWKVFSIGEDFDFSELQNYPSADLFLFDTKTKNHGGTGKKFNWSLLNRIDKESQKKYFLAGGIGPGDANEIKRLKLKNLIGLDLNSRFEIEPGIKDVKLLKEFLNELRA